MLQAIRILQESGPTTIDKFISWFQSLPPLYQAALIFIGIVVFSSIAASSESSSSSGKSYSRAHLVQASPRRFEELVGEMYEDKGYDVTVKPEGPDDGIDVIAEDRRETVAVQAKRYQTGNRVSAPTVRRVSGAARQYGADRAVIATSSKFTSPAEEAAEDLNVDLINGNEMANRLSD